MSDDIVATIHVENIDGELLVDSRLISDHLEIQHEAVMKNLRKYAEQFQSMGHLRFEIGTVTNSVGARNQVNFAYLNECQSTFLMTLSRNTDQVVKCKADLSMAFERAKAMIKKGSPNNGSLSSGPSKELVAAREIREISDTLDDNPRLAQCLIDSLVNRVLDRNVLPESRPQGLDRNALPAPQRRGVAEIATEMGYKVDMSSRVKLGQFIKAQGFESGKEKRLCNGVMAEINCYYDTPELREAIAAFFEH